MPRMNRCGFAGRVVAVKRKCRLTIDTREAQSLEGVLSGCASTEKVMAEGQAQVAEPAPSTAVRSTDGHTNSYGGGASWADGNETGEPTWRKETTKRQH